MSEQETPVATDEFVCFPTRVGVGYVHPLDIIVIADEDPIASEEEEAVLIVRGSGDSEIVYRVTCRASELHRRRMAAFAFVRAQQEKAFAGGHRSINLTGSA